MTAITEGIQYNQKGRKLTLLEQSAGSKPEFYS